MKVIKTKANKGEISSEIDILSGVAVSPRTRSKIKKEVVEFLEDVTLDAVGNARSPIGDGAKFPSLEPKYKAQKIKAGGAGRANLELTGDMLDSFGGKTRTRNSDTIKMGVFGSDAGKADGHNNFSGKSKLKKRQFLPKKNQKYAESIRKEVKNIIDDHLIRERRLKKSQLSSIQNKTQLNSMLRELFPSLSLQRAKEAVLRDDELVADFSEFDLLDFF